VAPEAPEVASTMEQVLEKHSGEILILVLSAMVMVALLVLVPKLLQAQHKTKEMRHAERLRALEKGQVLPPPDDRSWAAGRTAFLVPMVVVCAAATVTCFLAAYRTEALFSVALAVWSVAGVVSLAAITGGVALLGRLAQLGSGDEEEQPPDNPLVDETLPR
jgi:cytochrome bd-type quinol oxidase subunit 2